MGSPTGMPHPNMAFRIFIFQKIRKVAYFPSNFICIDVRATTVNQRYSGAIIPSIFKPLQTFYQDWTSIPFTNIGYYSTHIFIFLLRAIALSVSESKERFTAAATSLA